ncbi:MAG: DUF368 domain-containing protein [Solobacterium sp.]|nr:DUF368 domain-containing protein [Solobacterium sp.]
MEPKSVREWILLVCKGAVTGSGAILPGISGGVLCVAFGIYEPMMALLAHPVSAFKKYYRMFIPFLLGWVLGFFLLARLVEMLFAGSSAIAMMLFAGLIFGTLPQLLQEINEDTKTSWSPLILSLVFAVLLFSSVNASIDIQIRTDPLIYAFAGAVWGLSMILPGLSSSSLLILLGIYQPMTSGIAALDPGVILPLVTGLGVTVLALSRIVTELFEKKRGLILKIISGIVIASTLSILPSGFPTVLQLSLSLLCFTGGYVLARNMDIRKEKMI